VTLAPTPTGAATEASEPSLPEAGDDEGGTPRQRVIVDYSPTVSDVGALLYLLTSPDVEVVAITLPVTGEARCDLGMEVTLGVLALLGREDVPVACDPDRPEDAGEWPIEFLTGMDSLSDWSADSRGLVG
jgi:inosine-uridine nucleoside N-ribohydrolase